MKGIFEGGPVDGKTLTYSPAQPTFKHLMGVRRTADPNRDTHVYAVYVPAKEIKNVEGELVHIWEFSHFEYEDGTPAN